jgi:threonine synthase
MFYYFYAYAQLARMGAPLDNIVISVPSGNFGNITAGLIGKRMGLPIKRFIAANNRNDIFFQYLQTGEYTPRPSIATIANAMDVGDPSNFARILDLYRQSHTAIVSEISGCTYTDEEIAETLKDTYNATGYLLDPHGAVGYRSLLENLKENEIGVLISSHNLSGLEKICDSVTMIHEGKVDKQMSMEGMKGVLTKLNAVFEGGAGPALYNRKDILRISNVGSIYTLVIKDYDENTEKELKEIGASLIEPVNIGLEELFVTLEESRKE